MNETLFHFKNHDWLFDVNSGKLVDLIKKEKDIEILKKCMNEVHTDFGMIKLLIKQRIDVLMSLNSSN